MSIDTEIKGEPDSVAQASSWLNGEVQSAASSASSALSAVSGTPGWEGSSAAAFGVWASGASTKADNVASTASDVAAKLRVFALSMQRCQDRMKAIRAAARGAELDVAGFVIADPGAGPGRPGPLPAATPGMKLSPASKQRHADAVAAFEEHQAKVKAYQRAKQDADEVRDDMDKAGAALDYNGVEGFGWFMTGGDFITGAVIGTAGTARSMMSKKADAILEKAQQTLDRLPNHEPWHADEIREEEGRRDRDLRDADRAEKRAKGFSRLGKAGGGAFSIVGGVHDVVTGDKPVDQAVVSGGGSFLASVGAGAGMGALGGSIGGPPGALIGGVGGAAAGAVAGILTSGIIDDAFENGLGLGNVAAGAEAVYDTGKVVVGGAVDVAEGAADVAKDVGSALNPFD